MYNDIYTKKRQQALKNRKKLKRPSIYIRIGGFELFNTGKKA